MTLWSEGRDLWTNVQISVEAGIEPLTWKAEILPTAPTIRKSHKCSNLSRTGNWTLDLTTAPTASESNHVEGFNSVFGVFDRGFVKYARSGKPYRSAKQRIKDWKEIYNHKRSDLKVQTARWAFCAISILCLSPKALRKNSEIVVTVYSGFYKILTGHIWDIYFTLSFVAINSILCRYYSM